LVADLTITDSSKIFVIFLGCSNALLFSMKDPFPEKQKAKPIFNHAELPEKA